LSSNSWHLGATYFLDHSDFFINIDMDHVNHNTGPSSKRYAHSAGYYLSDDWFVTLDTKYDEDLEYKNMTVGTKKRIDLGDDTFLSVNARC
jgi:hypothetical protein